MFYPLCTTLLFETASLTEPGLTNSARLVVEQTPRVPLSPPPQTWGYRNVPLHPLLTQVLGI